MPELLQAVPRLLGLIPLTTICRSLVAAGSQYLQHVHMASRGRRIIPGEDGELEDYRQGFKALKEIGYDKFVTFECGCEGDRKVTRIAAVELLRKQWDEV